MLKSLGFVSAIGWPRSRPEYYQHRGLVRSYHLFSLSGVCQFDVYSPTFKMWSSITPCMMGPSALPVVVGGLLLFL